MPGLFGVLLHVQAHSATAYQAVLDRKRPARDDLSDPDLDDERAAMPFHRRNRQQPPALPRTSQTQGRAAIPLPRQKLSPAFVALTARMTVPQILIGFGAAILIPYMNVFYKVRFNISDSDLGLLFSLSSLLIGIGSIMAPWLSSRLGGKVRAVVVTQFGSLVFLLMTGFAPFLWLSSAGYLLRTAPDEHVFAFVLRLLHGAHPRTPAGIGQQHPEPVVEHRLGGGAFYLRYRTATLWLHIRCSSPLPSCISWRLQ